jgi:hypothetical protein
MRQGSRKEVASGEKREVYSWQFSVNSFGAARFQRVWRGKFGASESMLGDDGDKFLVRGERME